MASLGGTPVKVLATVTAVLTVVAGAPRVQCVCPDGRVKLFYTDHPARGCCCSQETPSDSAAANTCCCAAAGRTNSCCGHASPSIRSTPAGWNTAVNACGCQKSVVTGAAAVAAEDEAGKRSRPQDAAPAARSLPPADTGHAGGFARVGQRHRIPPPDLVVLFCHFTC